MVPHEMSREKGKDYLILQFHVAVHFCYVYLDQNRQVGLRVRAK